MGVETDTSETLQPVPTEATADRTEELLEAARYDDIDDVVSLFSMGVSLDSKDSQGRTALHMAAANGHLDIVEYLIRNGVDVNASNAEKNTPLHWACLNGHIEVVKALILGGATVSALNSHERTPMDEAVNIGKIEVVDAISTAVAQLELSGVIVSYSVCSGEKRQDVLIMQAHTTLIDADGMFSIGAIIGLASVSQSHCNY